MDDAKKISKHEILLYGAIGGLILFAILIRGANAIVTYGASTSLGPNSVQGKHILDGTITNIDITGTSTIATFKLGDTASGTIPWMMQGRFNASSTDLFYNSYLTRFGVGTSSPATTTSINGSLLVNGNGSFAHLTATGTLTMRGVNYLWPAAQGAADTFLGNNGSGVLSWSTAGGWADDGTVVRLATVTDSVGIGTTTPTSGSRLSLDYSGTQRPFVIMSPGSSTPVFEVRAGTTTFDFEHTGFNQATVAVYTSTQQSLGASATTAIAYDIELHKTVVQMHSNSVSNSRLTAPYDGYYQINGCSTLRSSTTQTNETVRFALARNGTYSGPNILSQHIQNPDTVDTGKTVSQCLTTVRYLSKDDFVELVWNVNQLNYFTDVGFGNNFSMVLVGK